MADYKKGDTASWDAGEVRRSRGEQQSARPAGTTRRRRRRRINPLIYLLCVLIASAILAGVGWLLMSDFCAFNRGVITKATVEVTADDTVGTIAEKLEDAGLIQYKWFFRLFAGVTDAREKIGIGTYELNTDMDYRALVTGMRSSSGNMNADTVRVTIPEGYTVAQTIALLAKNNVNTAEALTEAAQTAVFDYDFIDNNAGDISRLEGYLFPDTYEFYVGHDPKNALERLINNFDRKLDEDRLAQIQASGHSLREIITIASLIEKETDGTDQNMIASVIYNRLNDSGSHGTYKMLNIDASLLYALPDHQGPITAEDMQVDSRYNLYKYAGLPPTPIANPGLTAIDAALYPSTSDYYYYALGKDGKHRFSKTLEEHNAFLNSGEYGG
ncbi:endolytic transglycosylase MltG [uncultured Oscillibacter sp.]|uniref:endolytic transglycosylase MltG n=1 Tax=uncultured Oscillibacter sp. TaxID=876091 RepID=UPI0025E04BF7|nr:endolytic transglycosylase MltG [uncultured Oscillibacter sp.]